MLSVRTRLVGTVLVLLGSGVGAALAGANDRVRVQATRRVESAAKMNATNDGARAESRPARLVDGSVSRSGEVFSDPSAFEDWVAMLGAYADSGIGSVVGPIEIVAVVPVVDGKGHDGNRLALAHPDETILEAADRVRLVDDLILDAGAALYVGDVVEDGLIANRGDTAFLVRLDDGGEVLLPPAIELAIVPTKAGTCCYMCDSCADDQYDGVWSLFYCSGCDVCDALGYPRERGRHSFGTPCMEE